MKHKIFFIFFAAYLLTACEKFSFISGSEDPVEGLKKVMQQLQQDLNNQAPIITPPSIGKYYTEWYSRQIYTSPLMEFDVTKTNSVVSPHTGVISFECNARFAKGNSKEAVENVELKEFITSKCRATYSHQENNWIFKTLACQHNPINPNNFTDITSGDTSVSGQCRDIANKQNTKQK